MITDDERTARIRRLMRSRNMSHARAELIIMDEIDDEEKKAMPKHTDVKVPKKPKPRKKKALKKK